MPHICVRYPHVCQMNMPHIFTNAYKIYMPHICKISTFMSGVHATYMCMIFACVSDEYATFFYKYIQDLYATHMQDIHIYVRYPHTCHICV